MQALRRLAAIPVITIITLLSLIALPTQNTVYADEHDETTTEECTLADDVYGIPTWYKYLDAEEDSKGKCQPVTDLGDSESTTKNVFSAIALAVLDILLFLAGIVSVGFVVFGGFQYMLTQGEPEKSKNARTTIINALIGLAIAIVSSTVVRFIGGSL